MLQIDSFVHIQKVNLEGQCQSLSTSGTAAKARCKDEDVFNVAKVVTLKHK